MNPCMVVPCVIGNYCFLSLLGFALLYPTYVIRVLSLKFEVLRSGSDLIFKNR